MKYSDDMTEADIETFLADLAALDEAYTQAWLDRMEADSLAQELETEADLYRYWGP